MPKPRPDEVIAGLFDAHASAMLLYARQWMGAAEAEDVVQRVFVRLLAGSALPHEARPWLFRCVRNEAMAAWRARERRIVREQRAASTAASWFDPASDDPMTCAEAQAALATLPLELREVVTLRLWGDLTLSQIAQVTEVAVSTVHARYAAAIEALRKILESPCQNKM